MSSTLQRPKRKHNYDTPAQKSWVPRFGKNKNPAN